MIRSEILIQRSTVWYFTSDLVDNTKKVAECSLYHDLARDDSKGGKEASRLVVTKNWVYPHLNAYKIPIVLLQGSILKII